MRQLFVTVSLICCLSLPAAADSPATSTPFASAYLDLPLVAQAAETQVLSAEMLDWLQREAVPLDQKLALVNALGWNFAGQSNHLLYGQALEQKYARPLLDGSHLTGEEQLILGYLSLMDNYFASREPLPLIRRGARRLWQQQSAQWVLAIAEAQDYISRPQAWCQIWLQAEQIRQSRGLQADLRPQGVREIMDYLQLYQAYCP